MIIGFPSQVQEFEVIHPAGRDSPIGYAHYAGRPAGLRAPIDLKQHDRLWIDIRQGRVEIVERTGIVIWRASWLN